MAVSLICSNAPKRIWNLNRHSSRPDPARARYGPRLDCATDARGAETTVVQRERTKQPAAMSNVQAHEADQPAQVGAYVK
jgi:hypothetical protein